MLVARIAVLGSCCSTPYLRCDVIPPGLFHRGLTQGEWSRIVVAIDRILRDAGEALSSAIMCNILAYIGVCIVLIIVFTLISAPAAYGFIILPGAGMYYRCKRIKTIYVQRGLMSLPFLERCGVCAIYKSDCCAATINFYAMQGLVHEPVHASVHAPLHPAVHAPMHATNNAVPKDPNCESAPLATVV